jgi:predicted Zn-dependent protease
MRILPFAFILALAACEPVEVDTGPEVTALQPIESGAKLSRGQALSNFRAVVGRIEPVAERFCRERSPQQNCDFRIVIDDRSGQPANAYQTLDPNGRPIIAFTIPLIAEARNRDEIAFVMAHEAAHHVEGHIARQQQNAILGASLLGALAGSLGTSTPETINSAQQLGAAFGARTYSKGFELEADALGTRITDAAGFDPLVGAQFFFRIPDPGDRFLGTHPANADRLRTVQRVAASL